MRHRDRDPILLKKKRKTCLGKIIELSVPLILSSFSLWQRPAWASSTLFALLPGHRATLPFTASLACRLDGRAAGQFWKLHGQGSGVISWKESGVEKNSVLIRNMHFRLNGTMSCLRAMTISLISVFSEELGTGMRDTQAAILDHEVHYAKNRRAVRGLDP
ncbi:uncharacterized protein LOC144283091 [Canis aureus]